MRKLLIILLALVITLLIVFVFGNEQVGEEGVSTPTPTPTATSEVDSGDVNNNGGEGGNNETGQDLPSTHVVEIFDDRFKPANLTISAGDTVQFVNEGSKKHWPASDVHPTHTICEEFDALKGLNPGETYEYTFNKVETCPMHDHMQPSLKGKIVVEPR